MKAAIFINEGLTQVVLTPENDWEKSALRMIANSAGMDVKTFWETFYECRGGWLREGKGYGSESLLFRIDKKMEIPEGCNET